MIEKLKFNYEKHCGMNSDINEHLPVLVEYGKECSHITEMGVRWGNLPIWGLILSSFVPQEMFGVATKIGYYHSSHNAQIN